MNIVLIGYRGTGKTVVGKLLAEKLDRELINMDARIVEKAGLTIPEIVEECGWERFRDLESEVAEEVSGKDNCVIDTGGGVILRSRNVEQLKKRGVLFWLGADEKIIAERIGAGKHRPSLTGKKSFLGEIHEVLSARTPLYEAACDHPLDTSTRSPEEIAREIITFLSNPPCASEG